MTDTTFSSMVHVVYIFVNGVVMSVANAVDLQNSH